MIAILLAPIVIGNLAIFSTFLLARLTTDRDDFDLAGIHHLRRVDDRVWRGDAPDRLGYRSLAEHGVTTVVDLRAERDLVIPTDLLDELGLARFNLPVRDGQTPTPAQVARFMAIVGGAPGTVFVHCGAGVGRTGAMVAAYLVAADRASPRAALVRNLSVGPPSLEQIFFVGDLGDGVETPPKALSLFSRYIDGPRRIWTHLRFDSGIEERA